MKRFLIETWELFWWAFWCPSRLQDRLNKWCPRKKDKNGNQLETKPSDILVDKFNVRFVSQFLFLTTVLSFPLIIDLTRQEEIINWLQLPLIFLIAYAISVWFIIPTALIMPLLWWIVTFTFPNLLLETFNLGLRDFQNILPSTSKILLSFVLLIFSMGMVLSLVYWQLQKKKFF